MDKTAFTFIDPGDSVIVALRKIEKGETINIDDQDLSIEEEISFGHKIAIKKIAKGEKIIKYGYPIGIAAEEIQPGQWVHSHNVSTSLHGLIEYEYQPEARVDKDIPLPLSFKGYLRENGQAGIRNHVFIIPTVFCANGPIEKISQMANTMFPAQENFDGFLPLTHPYGCSQTGHDLEYTQAILAGLAHNSNAASVLIVSLGCEINCLESFIPALGQFDPNRIKLLNLQECENELEVGLDLCKELYQKAVSYRREELPLSKLVIGVNCGGSDGLSGITANPLVGQISNIVTEQGGTIVMTEVPEMFGAEQILMNRAENEVVFNKIENLINDYKNYFIKYGEEIYENPTQGNRAGGITTLEEKSLGCIHKAGTAIVTDVLKYGERIKTPGLNLLSGPGNDLVGVTAQIAAGCNLIIFTTGRGTPGGFAGPTFRIATNSQLYNKKPHWNDFNAGLLLEGADLGQLTDDLFMCLMKIVNGENKTKNEINNYYEIGILRDGVTL